MNKKKFKSGFVAIVGRPNVGKSTLLNSLIEEKISIVSSIPQTTRHQIRGISNAKDYQIVFVDTPGVHSFKDKLTSHLNKMAKSSLEGCDLVLYVVDISRKPGLEERDLLNFLVNQDIKVLMVLNKTDLRKKFFNDYIDLWKEKTEKIKKDPLIYYIPCSAKLQKNIEEIKEALVENLPQGMPFYDKECLTDFPKKFRVADIIREKLFLNLQEELPHSVAVEVESEEDKKSIVSIKVNIYVIRNSQKKIVVGKNGEVLKRVGKLSRLEIEKIYNKKVFLDIWVKVLADWQDKPRILKELGYWWM